MNRLNAFLNNISEEDLKKCVLELRNKEDKGILQDGKVRELSKKIEDEFSISSFNALTIIETGILRIAAFKWAGIRNC